MYSYLIIGRRSDNMSVSNFINKCKMPLVNNTTSSVQYNSPDDQYTGDFNANLDTYLYVSTNIVLIILAIFLIQTFIDFLFKIKNTAFLIFYSL